MRHQVEELRDLEDRLRLGGGPQKIEKQHRDSKLTARERIDRLIDRGTLFLEIGLLVAYDQYDGTGARGGRGYRHRQDRATAYCDCRE